VIRFAAQYFAPSENQLIGFIRVGARYQVRGRRLGTTSVEQIRIMMDGAGITAEMLRLDNRRDVERSD
jgi:hypothetical protein